MDNFDFLPATPITDRGRVGKRFLENRVRTFRDACEWVRNIEYGYNTSNYDGYVVFDEERGTCQTKHSLIAELAAELDLPVHKYLMFYRLDENIIEGVGKILEAHGLLYVPQTHCALKYEFRLFDLTEGNCHGKKKDITDFDVLFKVGYRLSKEEKEALYFQGVRYYQLNDPVLAKISDSALLAILAECDEKHRFLCSLLSGK